MTSPAEVERVRAYVLAQANKLMLPKLVEKVREDTAPLREVAAAVPAARFSERPANDEWSAAEVFSHILDMNDRGADAIEGILDRGALPAAIDDVMSGATRPGLQTADEYWRAFQARRERLFVRVLAANGDEHSDVKIRHAWFGEFSWREWLLFMRVHDIDHLRQLRAIVERYATQ